MHWNECSSHNKQSWFSLCSATGQNSGAWAHWDGRSGCVFPFKGVKADGWIILNVLARRAERCHRQSPFLQGPYLCQSCLYLPNGPLCGYATATTHWWHRGGQHTLTALDLICFNLRQKTRRIKEKQSEGGERRECLFSQMKWKAQVAAICQTEQRFSVGSDYWGIFFFRRCRSNYTVEEKDVWGWWSGRGGDGRQLSWGRWICREEAHNFKNFYIYNAKHAPLPHTHTPFLKDN